VTGREHLEALPTKTLHDRAIGVARRRMDVGFLWRLIEALPFAEAVVGDEQRSKVDVMRPLALINDLFDAGEGELGEALRPLYVDYLEEHGQDLTADDVAAEPPIDADG
jgi:hypothetical protein